MVEECAPVTIARTAESVVALPARGTERARTGPLEADQERALVELARSGDRGAFRELYERYAPSVHRFAILPLVRDRTLAEDLLSDTFVRALENLHRFRWQGKGVLPWLIRIAKNISLDHLRKSGRSVAWPTGMAHQVPDPTEWNAETLVARDEMADVLRQRIEASIGAINPRYQKVLRLRIIDKVPRADAASEMNVSIGTLDVLLFRACKAFRKVYIERHDAGPDDPFSVTP
jgi:RNA polymerase sigma-70 factor (ECF subfamily)